MTRTYQDEHVEDESSSEDLLYIFVERNYICDQVVQINCFRIFLLFIQTQICTTFSCAHTLKWLEARNRWIINNQLIRTTKSYRIKLQGLSTDIKCRTEIKLTILNTFICFLSMELTQVTVVANQNDLKINMGQIVLFYG